jgi:hypothetical protein
MDNIPSGTDKIPHGIDNIPRGADKIPHGIDKIPGAATIISTLYFSFYVFPGG